MELEEYEDETMDSGDDVEALTFAPNRNNQAISQASGNTSGQFHSSWQTTSNSKLTCHNQQGAVGAQRKQHLSDVELKKPRSGFGNQQQEDNSQDPHSQHEQPLPAHLGIPQMPMYVDEPCGEGNEEHASKKLKLESAIDQQALTTGAGIQILGPIGMGKRQAPAIGINNRQAISSVLRNQQVIKTGAGNHQPMAKNMSSRQLVGSGFNSQQPANLNTLQHSPVSGMTNSESLAVGKNNQQSLPSRSRNQHVCNSGLSKQQTMSVEVANQQGNSFNRGSQAAFAQLLLIITPLLDRDKRMQLQTVYHKRKRNEITKVAFFRHMRTIVGDQMLKMVVYTLKLQYGRITQKEFNQRMANLVLKMVMEEFLQQLNSRIPLAPSPTTASQAANAMSRSNATTMSRAATVSNLLRDLRKVRVSNCGRSARKKGGSRFLRSAKKKEVFNLSGAKEEGVSTTRSIPAEVLDRKVEHVCHKDSGSSTPVSCSSEGPAEIGECKHKSRSSCLDHGLEGTSTLCKDCDADKGKSKRSLQDQLEKTRKLNKALIDVLARKHSDNNALKEKLSEAQVQIKEAESRGKLNYLASEEHKEDVRAHAEKMSQSSIEELKVSPEGQDWLSSKDEKDSKHNKFDENTKSSKE